MILYTFVLDLAVMRVLSSHSQDYMAALNVLASSFVVLTFHTHTFSNSLESVLLALAIYLYYGDLHSFYIRALKLGFLTGLALHVRFTAMTFLFPLGILHLVAAFKTQRSARMASYVCIGWFLGACLSSYLLHLLDSWYFGLKVFTPLNSFHYNANFEVVAREHGLHPRWLHALVNMPLLFGPLYLVALWQMGRLRGVSQWHLPLLLVVPLSLLSLAPHQEARFLLPLTVPLVLLAAPRVWNYHVWLRRLWLFFNALLLIVFLLHQTGLTLALLDAPFPPTGTSLHVHVCGTYMPPHFLMARPKGFLTVEDQGESCLVGNPTAAAQPWEYWIAPSDLWKHFESTSALPELYGKYAPFLCTEHFPTAIEHLHLPSYWTHPLE
jgi:GPI mannosyltransferase 4